MNFNRRVEDISKVVDKQWNVTHNYQERNTFFEGRREHLKELYNADKKNPYQKEVLRMNSVNGRVQNLNERMNAANTNERLAKLNDFKNNFR